MTTKRSEKGAAMVEFALVSPMLIMLVLGIVQFGLMLNQIQGLHAAAREGARTASVPSSSYSDIEDVIDDALVGVSGDYEISIDPEIPEAGDALLDSPCEDREGETVTIEVNSDYTLDIPFFSGEKVDLEGRGTFRCERRS